jgi:hypothetical protein
MRITLLTIGLVVLISGAAVAQNAEHPAKGAKAAGKASKAEKAAEQGGAANDEKIADQLKAFCVKWMGFLETRERDNKKGIKWEPRGGGVAGHYVGYSKEYDCTMKPRASNGTPVATIQYKELIYEKAGGSRGEAEQAEASVIEATEVTEIFRYNKGEWIY